MRGTFVINFTGTVSAAATLLQIKAGATNPLEILRATITNVDSVVSDQGQALLQRMSVSDGVTAQTPILLDRSGGAAKAVGSTAGTGDTGSSAGTSSDIIVREGFNILAGWTWLPTPEERLIVPGAGIIALKNGVAISPAVVNAQMFFRELG